MSRTVVGGTPVRGPASAGAASWKGYVKDKDLTAPPGSPTLDDSYIVASVATGAWATHEDDVATWDGIQWIFDTPEGGWTLWVEDEAEVYVYNGASWGQESFGPHAPTHKGGGADEIDAATVSVNGLMPAADKDKLDGLFTVIRTTDNIEAILEAAADGSSFWLEDGVHTAAGIITISSKKNMTIRGGRGAIVTISGTDIFRIEGCEDFVMEGFTISIPGDYGVMVSIGNAGAGSYQIPTRHHYRNLHFETTGGSSNPVDAINISDNFVQSSIEDCTFDGRYYAIVNMGVTDATGSSIVRNNVAVTYSDGGTCFEVGSTVGRAFLLSQNYVEGPFDYGIRIVGTDYAEVSSNHVTGSLCEGIDVSSTSSHVSVVDNAVYDAGADGIEVAGDNAIVSNNHVYSAAGDGVKLTGSSQSLVTDNMLEANGGYGINADSASANCSFEHNHYNGNTSGTLNLQGTNEHQVDGTIRNRVSTTDATVTTIATIPIPDDTSVWIEVNVINRQTNAANRGKFKRGALVYREAAGAATKEGATWTPLTIKSVLPAQWDVTIVVSGSNALIQAEGLAAQDINWESRHTLEERS